MWPIITIVQMDLNYTSSKDKDKGTDIRFRKSVLLPEYLDCGMNEWMMDHGLSGNEVC